MGKTNKKKCSEQIKAKILNVLYEEPGKEWEVWGTSDSRKPREGSLGFLCGAEGLVTRNTFVRYVRELSAFYSEKNESPLGVTILYRPKVRLTIAHADYSESNFENESFHALMDCFSNKKLFTATLFVRDISSGIKVTLQNEDRCFFLALDKHHINGSTYFLVADLSYYSRQMYDEIDYTLTPRISSVRWIKASAFNSVRPVGHGSESLFLPKTSSNEESRIREYRRFVSKAFNVAGKMHLPPAPYIFRESALLSKRDSVEAVICIDNDPVLFEDLLLRYGWSHLLLDGKRYLPSDEPNKILIKVSGTTGSFSLASIHFANQFSFIREEN